MGNFFSDIGDKLESAWDKVEKQVDRSYDDFREFQYKSIPYMQMAGQVLGPFVPGLSTATGLHAQLWGKDEGGSMPTGGDSPVLMFDPNYNIGGLPLGVAGLPPGTGGYTVGGNWTEEPQIFTQEWTKKYQTALLLGGGALLLYLIV